MLTMSERPTDPEDHQPFDDEPIEAPDHTVEPEAEPEQPKRYANVTPARRALWVVGGAVGIYMIGRGVYGLITDEDQQP